MNTCFILFYPKFITVWEPLLQINKRRKWILRNFFAFLHLSEKVEKCAFVINHTVCNVFPPQGSATSRQEWNEINSSDRPRPQNEKAFLARIWGSFDTCYMKPLLTHSRPTLLETLPVCCNPLARWLTTTEQMTQVTYDLFQ